MAKPRALRFQSPPQVYGIRSQARPATVQLQGWVVREAYQTGSRSDIAPDLGDYRIVLETTVSSLQEFWDKRSVAFDIAHDLDRVWTYVCCRPLLPLHMTLEIVEAPDGWTSNAQDVENAIRLEDAELVGVTSIVSRHWLYSDVFPLKSAIPVLRNFRGADAVTRHLIELHYEALKSPAGNCRLMLFAKALELVRSLLPGHDNDAKQESLPATVQAELKSPLNWLFNMANKRIDIRHVVREPGLTPLLHKPLSSDERLGFEHGADLVVRAVVCGRLQCEVPVVHRADGPSGT